MSKKLNIPNGKNITIGDKPFAKGGEGELYKILAPRSMRNKCAKVILKSKRSSQREQKVQYLINNPPPSLEGDRYAICWPELPLYEGKIFVGFTMAIASSDAIELKELCSEKDSKTVDYTWSNKFRRSHRQSLETRLKLCYNIARAISLIHDTGKYVLLDLKPPNILIAPKGDVFIIDCDSIQVSSGSQKLFSGSALTMEYAPPEASSTSLTKVRVSIASVSYTHLTLPTTPYV